MQFDFKKFLQTNAGKAAYVATVTLTLSAVGSWAVLAHQDSPAMKADNTKMSAASSKPSMSDTHFAKEAAAGARSFSLDAYKDTGVNSTGQKTQTHFTFKFFVGQPTYDVVRQEIIAVATGKTQPISSRSGIPVQ